MARHPRYLDAVEDGIIIDALATYKAVLPEGHAIESQIKALLIRFRESD